MDIVETLMEEIKKQEKIIDWQNEKIERLRAALLEIKQLSREDHIRKIAHAELKTGEKDGLA